MERSDSIARLNKFTTAPIFIAYPVNHFLEEVAEPRSSPLLKLFLLCEIVEAAVRFIVIASSFDVIDAAPGRKAPAWLAKLVAENLNKPTFGQWFVVLRGLAEADAAPGFPELAEANSALAALAPGASGDAVPERVDIVRLRNAIAHGLGVPNSLGEELLALWLPRVAEAFDRLGWLVGTEVWVRDAQGFRCLSGPSTEVPLVSEPPEVVASHLRAGEVALRRGDTALVLYPLSRFAPPRADGTDRIQAFSRRVPGGLLYTLFGEPDALHGQGGDDEVEAFQRIFDLAAVRRAASMEAFSEPGYDDRFEAEAAEFVGREGARAWLFDAVGDPGATGLVYLFGPAGIGKSSLVARVAMDLRAAFEERRAKGTSDEILLVYRFADGDRGCAPLPFLRWLIERLAHHSARRATPKPQHALHDLREMALSLLGEAGTDRIVLVLDNLDEIARRHRRFILDLIPQLLRSENVLVLAATRPEQGLPEALEAAGGRSPLPEGLGGMSGTDLRIMLTELLPAISTPLVRADLTDRKLSNRFIDAMAERAEGLPLYVRLVADALMRGSAGLEQAARPDWLPPTVADFFRQITSEDRLTDKGRLSPDVAYLLALAREPLSTGEVGAFLVRNLSPEQAKRLRRFRGIDD